MLLISEVAAKKTEIFKSMQVIGAGTNYNYDLMVIAGTERFGHFWSEVVKEKVEDVIRYRKMRIEKGLSY